MNIHFHLKIVPASKLSQSNEYSFSSQNCPRFKIFPTLWLFILISKLSPFQNPPDLISIHFTSQNCPRLKIILILWTFILISKLSPFQNYFNLMNIPFHLKIVPASKLSQSYEYSFSSQNCPCFKIFPTLWLLIFISKLSPIQNHSNLMSIHIHLKIAPVLKLSQSYNYSFSSQNCPRFKIIPIL